MNYNENAVNIIRDPMLVQSVVDGFLALFLFAMMDGCDCTYCRVHRLCGTGP